MRIQAQPEASVQHETDESGMPWWDISPDDRLRSTMIEIFKTCRDVRSRGYPTNFIRALWIKRANPHQSALWCAHKSGKTKWRLKVALYVD